MLTGDGEKREEGELIAETGQDAVGCAGRVKVIYTYWGLFLSLFLFVGWFLVKEMSGGLSGPEGMPEGRHEWRVQVPRVQTPVLSLRDLRQAA